MDDRGRSPLCSRPRSLARGLALFVAVTQTAACPAGDDGDGGGTGGDGGELEFAAELPFLPGFDADTGWLPADSPVAVRAHATASGGVSLGARAIAGDPLTPVAGSGLLAVSGMIELAIDARIDAAGVMYEGPVESFGYAIEGGMVSFDPFALQAAVPLSTALPAADLGSVPIPSVPGATLALSVSGGQLDTAFQGTCAAVRDGFAQYTGVVTVSGTIELAATVLIEVPLLDPVSFGPFALALPIPETRTDADLGTRSFDGAEAGPMGICDAVDPSGSASAADTGDPTGEDPSDATSADAGDSADATSADATGSSSSSGGDSSTGSTGDANYPNPGELGCPPDAVGVAINTEPDNAICLPPCFGDAQCPDPETGGAVPVCGFNPESSLLECTTDPECAAAETCVDGFCQRAPSHCILLCDDASPCPVEMQCLLGACTYPQ